MARSEQAAARQRCTCWPTAHFVTLLPLAGSGAGEQQKDATPLVTGRKSLHLSDKSEHLLKPLVQTIMQVQLHIYSHIIIFILNLHPSCQDRNDIVKTPASRGQLLQAAIQGL